MSDLILSINFDESIKKNNIVMETYEGVIPKLKSKRFSGQLRSVNINSVDSVDNLNCNDLKNLKKFLYNDLNVQISKNQFLIANKNLLKLNFLIDLNCLFYQEKKNGMYQITSIRFEAVNIASFYEINGLKFCGRKTEIVLCIDSNIDYQKLRDIHPVVYIDLSSKRYPLELILEYDNYSINYRDKERNLGNDLEFRDYNYELKYQKYIENCGWKYKNKEGFLFFGEDVNLGITMLSKYDIKIFTNTGKKVNVSDFSNVKVSYDLDWFDIKGTVKYDNNTVDISTLLNLKKHNENWVEYKGNIVLLPTCLSSKAVYIDKNENRIKIEKKNVFDAINIAQKINGNSIENLENFIDYRDVDCDIEDKIYKILRPYQMVGVKWLLALRKNGFGGCLADDMGLGKTLQIIAYLSDKSMQKSKNLIVVPKTLLTNWQREITKFSESASIYIYHGVNRNTNSIYNYKYIVTTYQTVVKDLHLLNQFKFDNLIIDEAQYIKNPKSKAYIALKNIQADMKIILTGTPLENNVYEFMGLMHLINPDIIKPHKSTVQTDSEGLKNIKLMTSPFILRRMKTDVLNELPEKQEQVIYVKMDNEQQILYDTMLLSIQHEILRNSDKYEIKSNSIMLNGLLYLQEICCHPKLLDRELNKDGCLDSAKFDLLIEMINSLYSNGHKIVIFSRFTKMLKLIEKKLNYEHINYFYLDGKTKDRMKEINDFESSKTGVFLISLKAGGTGINLTSADVAIIYDPWWNPAAEKQAEDRIYRIGQNKNVIIYRLIVEGTIEEKIQKLQHKKIELSSNVLDGHEMPMNLTSDVLFKLLDI